MRIACLANLQMEPTRLTVCAILSPCRAAQLVSPLKQGLDNKDD